MTNSSNNRKESHRPGFYVETHLPVWFQVLRTEEEAAYRSSISDQAVRRRIRSEMNKVDEDLPMKAILERIDRLENRMFDLLEQITLRRERKFAPHPMILQHQSCELTLLKKEKLPKVGDWMDFRFLLPFHQYEEMLILAQVKEVHGSSRSRCHLSFVNIATDQADWIARYMIQKQREDLRIKNYGPPPMQSKSNQTK